MRSFGLVSREDFCPGTRLSDTRLIFQLALVFLSTVYAGVKPVSADIFVICRHFFFE